MSDASTGVCWSDRAAARGSATAEGRPAGQTRRLARGECDRSRSSPVLARVGPGLDYCGDEGLLLAGIGVQTSKVGSVDDNGSGRGYAYRASKAALNIGNPPFEMTNTSVKV
eukprot:1179802-Prorocentrum_minimum.AAC.5